MIELQDVTFCYGSSLQPALHHVSLKIERGECVLLAGLSGCGKTTVTRLINGLVPSFYEGTLTGNVQVAGQVVAAYPPGRLSEVVGSVFQNPRSQFFNMESSGEIAFGCENLGLERSEIQQRVTDTARQLHMEKLLDRDIFKLSGGEKQLIAIASACAMNPEVYVLDEPSANLDMAVTQRLKEILKALKAQGKTIVIAEHRLAWLRDVADRVVYMREGTIHQDISMDTFAALPESTRQQMGLRTLYPEQLVPAAADSVLPTESILEIEQLAGGYRKKEIFDSISLTAARGEIVGIIGYNGAGKSTLARCICGLQKETFGQVKCRGRHLSWKKRPEDIYLVLQEPGYQLFADSVEKELHIAFGPHEKDTARADAILEQMALSEKRERHPLSLSGGEKQRLSIAAALMRDCPVMFFDEPTSGLDYDNMARVAALFRALAADGHTVFLITHDYELLLRVCTRVLRVESGRIVRDSPMKPGIIPELQVFFNI